MISSLIDKLRKSADEWNGSNMFELARMCSDAADTIWQLRDDLQRSNADNAELRERIHELEMEGSDHFYRTAYAEDANRALEAENAKLQELCEEQLDNLMPEICAKAWWCEDKDWHTCNDDACGNYTFVILARELGIEVTE